MRQYKRVDKVPKKSELKDASVILTPSFESYVKGCRFMPGRGNTTTINYLRAIIQDIATDYDQNMNSMTAFNLSDYEGRPFKNETDIAKIIYEIIETQHPEIIKEFINRDLNKVPDNIALIYFVAKNLKHTDVFTNKGITMYNPNTDENQGSGKQNEE